MLSCFLLPKLHVISQQIARMIKTAFSFENKSLLLKCVHSRSRVWISMLYIMFIIAWFTWRINNRLGWTDIHCLLIFDNECNYSKVTYFVDSLKVWKKKIFRHSEDYNSANMTDIHKIPFDSKTNGYYYLSLSMENPSDWIIQWNIFDNCT